MSLSSSSTLAQIKAAYDDNARYDLDGSTTMAKDFIEACRLYLRRMAQVEAHGQMGSDKRIEDDYHKIEAALQAALKWWRSNDSTVTAGKITHPDFREFRS